MVNKNKNKNKNKLKTNISQLPFVSLFKVICEN